MTEKLATEPLYFNADRTKLVKEGDPDARSLAAAPGDPIPEVEKPAGSAKAAGAATEAGSEPDAAAKQTDKASDKAVKAHADKSAGG